MNHTPAHDRVRDVGLEDLARIAHPERVPRQDHEVRAFPRHDAAPIASAKFAKAPHGFEADAELIYVLRGRLNLAMQEEVHRLRPGDALLIVPREPDAWWNPSASRSATVLWIITPTFLETLPHLTIPPAAGPYQATELFGQVN